MLRVKTKLSNSNIHGIGLYADQDIEKGMMIWQLNPRTVEVFTPQEFYLFCEALPFNALFDFLNYSYMKDNTVYYVCDNARFINHSKQPNIGFLTTSCEIALRDIKKGEELLEDYQQCYDANDFYGLDDVLNTGDRKLVMNFLGRICAVDQDLRRQVCA